MERYNLRIFPAAERDLQGIIEYLNEFSPQAALKLYNEIVDRIGSLQQMPERYPPVKNTMLRLKGYRSMVLGNYVVFYIVNGDNVQIRRILHGRRQYEFLL